MWSLDNHYKVYKQLIDGQISLPAIQPQLKKLTTSLDQAKDHRSFSSNVQMVDPDLSRLIINLSGTDSLYGKPGTTTLDGALSHLPKQQIEEITQLFAIRNLILTDNLPANHSIRTLWEQSIRLASLCIAIESRINYLNPETSISTQSRISVKRSLRFQSNAVNPPSEAQPHQPSALAGLVYHIGTILLIHTFRNKGLAIPSNKTIDDVPSDLAGNIASLAAVQWKLPGGVWECALQRNQFKEVNQQPFGLVDIFHMAIIHYRKHHMKLKSELDMKHSLSFIKAVKHKFIRENADHFTQMIEAHSISIFRAMTPLLLCYPNHHGMTYGTHLDMAY